MISLEGITADGNDISFDNTEFRCGKMPRKEAFRLAEQIRVQVPKLKGLVMPLLVQAQQKKLDPSRMLGLIVDLIGVMETGFVEEAQDQMFAHIEFRTSPNGEFMPFNDMVADLAFAEMGITDIYVLMARCFWLNFKRDIIDWTDYLQTKWREEAVKQAVEAEAATSTE